MTINEFRAWLDGFKEAISEAPTAEQWAKVLEKLETVQQFAPVLPVTAPSLPGYPQWVPSTPVWCGPNTSTTSANPLQTFAIGDMSHAYEN